MDNLFDVFITKNSYIIWKVIYKQITYLILHKYLILLHDSVSEWSESFPSAFYSTNLFFKFMSIASNSDLSISTFFVGVFSIVFGKVVEKLGGF